MASALVTALLNTSRVLQDSLEEETNATKDEIVRLKGENERISERNNSLREENQKIMRKAGDWLEELEMLREVHTSSYIPIAMEDATKA